MDQKSYTLDEAIQNLEYIVARIIVEKDLQEKGSHIANGWR